MSVGLLAVRFQYGLYVVVHLSKFVSFFLFVTRSMSGVSCRFTLAANVLRLGVRFFANPNIAFDHHCAKKWSLAAVMCSRAAHRDVTLVHVLLARHLRSR